MTPLYYVTGKGHIKICQLLIDHGANMNVVDKVRIYINSNQLLYYITFSSIRLHSILLFIMAMKTLLSSY